MQVASPSVLVSGMRLPAPVLPTAEPKWVLLVVGTLDTMSAEATHSESAQYLTKTWKYNALDLSKLYVLGTVTFILKRA